MANTVVQYVLKVDSKGAQKSLDSTAKEAKDLTKSFDKLGNESTDVSKDLKKTERSSNKTSKGLKALKVAGTAAAGAIAGIATVAVGTIATIGALGAAYIRAQKAAFDFSREVVDNVNDLNDLSARSGLAAGSIQAVIAAFEGSGQSAAAAASFVSRFPRLFADLASGAGRASEAAARLGVSLKDANGDLKSADQILIDVTRGLQSIKDPTQRATEGFLLFGRQAGQFLQAFGATSEFENFLAITERFGVQTGPEASAAAARFQEQLAFLNVVVKGLQQRFVNAVGGVEFFNDGLLQAIKIVVLLQDFIAENEAQLAQLGGSMKLAAVEIITFFQQLLPAFASFVDFTFGRVTDRLTILMKGLNEVGIISDQTFTAISGAAESAQSTISTLSNITKNLSDVDFTGESGRGVGGRTGAQDVEGFLEKLLAGIGNNAKEARPPVDALADAIDKTGKAAKDQLTTQQKLQAAADSAFDNIKKVARSFQDIDPAVKSAEDTVFELRRNLDDLAEVGINSKLAVQTLQRAEEELEEARNKAAAAEKKRLQDDAFGKFSAIASLDPATIISLKNPLLGAFTGLVQGIGEKVIEKGPAQIRAEALAQAEAIKVGIAFLPELFLSIAPQLGIAIAEAFVDGILLLFVNLKDLIVDAFNSAFSFRDRSPDGNDRARRRRRRRQTALDFINPFESATFMGGGRFVPSAQGGIRFTGAQDGPAMLHRGEFVVPQSGQRPQQVDRQLNNTTGGGMTININSAVVDRNAVDALVREIEIRFNNQFGTSSSSLFGGR